MTKCCRRRHHRASLFSNPAQASEGRHRECKTRSRATPARGLSKLVCVSRWKPRHLNEWEACYLLLRRLSQPQQIAKSKESKLLDNKLKHHWIFGTINIEADSKETKAKLARSPSFSLSSRQFFCTQQSSAALIECPLIRQVAFIRVSPTSSPQPGTIPFPG